MPSFVMLLVEDQVALFLNYTFDGGEELTREERYAGGFLDVFRSAPGVGDELAVRVDYVG
jgi:hypothetical protein